MPPASLTPPPPSPRSIDGRSGPVQRAQHWADEDTLQRRAYFDLSAPQPGLVLHPVTASDEDEYRCRVDFKSSPTRNVRVNLTVIGECWPADLT